MSDTSLLSLIGLDAFMFLQTVKLFFRLFFILSFLFFPLLSTLYFRSFRSPSILLSISSFHISSFRMCALHSFLVFLASFLIFYSVFIYYKRYVSLRQLFLASPASMTSVAKLKRLAHELPDNCTAMEYVDVKRRTVVLERLPSGIKQDKECIEYVEKLGIGKVEDAVLIHNTYRLQKLYEERDRLVQEIEKEVHRAMWMMEEEYGLKSQQADEQHAGNQQHADGQQQAGSQQHAVSNTDQGPVADKSKTKRAKLYNDATRAVPPGDLSLDEKIRIGNAFFDAAENFVKKHGSTTTLRFSLAKFKRNEAEIAQEREQLNSERPEEVTLNVNVARSMFTEWNDTSFFPLSSFVHPIRNSELLGLDIPGDRPRAFVTFADPRTAAVVSQSKIGTRLFSCTASPAPSPHDVIWKNITKNETLCYIFRIFSSVCFVLLNIVFLYAVTRISNFLREPNVGHNPIFKALRNYPRLFALYEGLIKPLVYNILLFFIPILISTLLNLEGIRSYSAIQARMMSMLSYFLFFNCFVALFVSSSFVEILNSLFKGKKKIDDILTQIQTESSGPAALFLNTIIQRLLVGNIMVLLKPAPFLFNFFIAPLIRRTRRQAVELQFAPPVDFGTIVPNALLIFPMALVYSCIFPVILPFAALFYCFTYFVYKNEFVFASLNEFESGGLHWCLVARFVILSVIAFQFMAVLQFYLSGHPIFILPLVVLVLGSFLFFFEISLLFEKSCSNYPLNEPEEEFLDRFTLRAVEEREKLLSSWTEKHNEKGDELVLAEAQKGLKNPRRSFYRDPALASSSCRLMLPHGFYSVVRYLMDKHPAAYGFT